MIQSWDEEAGSGLGCQLNINHGWASDHFNPQQTSQLQWQDLSLHHNLNDPTLSEVENPRTDDNQTPSADNLLLNTLHVCCSFSKQDSKSVITRDLSGYAGPSFGTDDIDIAIHLKLSSLTRQEAGHFVCRVKTHLVVLEMLLSTDHCQNM